jgi:DNA-binding MarR family transcriptional regulator
MSIINKNIEYWLNTLSSLQHNIIQYLTLNPNADYKAISKYVDKDRITIKQSIDTLIKKRYVKKEKVYPDRERSKLVFNLTHKGLIYSITFLEEKINNLKNLKDNQFQEFLKYLIEIPKPKEFERFKATICLGFMNYDLFRDDGNMICENEYDITKQMFRIFLLHKTEDKNFDIEKLLLPEESGFDFMRKNYNSNQLLKEILTKLKENIEKSLISLSSW